MAADFFSQGLLRSSFQVSEGCDQQIVLIFENGAEIEEHERVKEARATLASGLRVVEALTGPDRSLNIVGRNAGGALVNEFVRLTFAEHGGIDPKLETEAIERAKKIAEHFKARRAKSAS